MKVWFFSANDVDDVVVDDDDPSLPCIALQYHIIAGRVQQESLVLVNPRCIGADKALSVPKMITNLEFCYTTCTVHLRCTIEQKGLNECHCTGWRE